MANSITFTDGVPATSPSTSTSGLCVRGDLENIYGIPNIIKWAILSGNSPTSNAGLVEITNRVDWAINLSSTDFRNAIRQGGYQLSANINGALSLVAVGSQDSILWQTNIVAIRAGMYLYAHLRPTERGPDGRPQPSHYDGLFAYADEQLNFVRARKLRLDALPTGRGTSGPFVTHEPSRGAYGPGQIGYGPNVGPCNFPFGG